jgi:transcription-repair coupling factor (superfamily II helicase)
LPAEVDHLLDVMEIKGLCRTAGIAKVDAGTKGAVVTFHRNAFTNAQGFAAFLVTSRGRAKLQPDHKLIFKGEWDQPEARFKGVRTLVSTLAEIAEKGRKAA